MYGNQIGVLHKARSTRQLCLNPSLDLIHYHSTSRVIEWWNRIQMHMYDCMYPLANMYIWIELLLQGTAIPLAATRSKARNHYIHSRGSHSFVWHFSSLTVSAIALVADRKASVAFTPVSAMVGTSVFEAHRNVFIAPAGFLYVEK